MHLWVGISNCRQGVILIVVKRHPNGLELAFIQRQGLAAWMEYGPDNLPPDAVSADLQMSGPGEVETPSHTLVLALADLVLGDRQEAQDGRSD